MGCEFNGSIGSRSGFAERMGMNVIAAICADDDEVAIRPVNIQTRMMGSSIKALQIQHS